MGVLGAFIFAAQMINFTIPATGSSGHLGGGLILAILLGPYAAFLTVASVLVVQAFFFADGGLLALGCNFFNLGFFPAFIAYPFVYKKIVSSTPSPATIWVASMAAAIIGSQLGAFGVVMETVLSGISSLPFSTFAIIVQPIHLAIGVVEGLVTASVISFVYKAKPEIIQTAPIGRFPIRGIALGFLAVTLLMGGVVSRFASEQPDGLEWSITKVTGQKEPKGSEQGLHGALAALQKNLSFLPHYSFKKTTAVTPAVVPASLAVRQEQKPAGKKSEGSRPGSALSGIVGGALTLGLSLLIGFMLKRRG